MIDHEHAITVIYFIVNRNSAINFTSAKYNQRVMKCIFAFITKAQMRTIRKTTHIHTLVMALLAQFFLKKSFVREKE